LAPSLLRSNLVHSSFKIRHLVASDFPEILPTREITTKTEKTSLSGAWPWAYFLNGQNADSIDSTHVNRAAPRSLGPIPVDIRRVLQASYTQQNGSETRLCSATYLRTLTTWHCPHSPTLRCFAPCRLDAGNISGPGLACVHLIHTTAVVPTYLL